MSLKPGGRRALISMLAAGALSLASSSSCGLFAAHGPSNVAQGKYYSSGDPRYDTFFLGLYATQVRMAAAPDMPSLQRQKLALSLGLPQEARASEIERRLRERTLELSARRVYLRLDRAGPQGEGAVIHSNARRDGSAFAPLITQVETSATRLLESITEMNRTEASLLELERSTILLDRDVDAVFAQAHFGKRAEVQSNLADAHKLIALMRARALDLRGSSERLLSQVSRAVDTDDGSLSSAPSEEQVARSEDHPEKLRAARKKAPLAVRPRSGTRALARDFEP